MSTNPPPVSPAAVLRARLARLASDPRVSLLPDGRAIARELSDVLAQIDDLARRQHATDLQLARLARLVELGALDPGPCS
jgi:hypothetical protein